MSNKSWVPIAIGVAVLVVLLGGGLFLITAGKNIGQFFFGRGYAEGELKDYVATVLKQEVNGATCQNIDTDNNGYVSCDYTVVGSTAVTRSLECAAWGLNGFLNRGCKARLPNFTDGQGS